MGQDNKLEKIDREKLPQIYKIILKLPFPDISNSINIPSGIFWAIIVPIAMILDFYLTIYFLVGFSSPINFILICTTPLVILVIFVRATAERFIDWWNSAVVGGYVQREVKKVLDEYIAMRERKDKEQTQR
jgi:hypothetical protein